jgi:catechol 2,3-dioxygenase-like lactoylglutathione lyase family enzyme
MISGAHAMIFTQDEEADRAFLRDVLEIPCIDSGGGWLIFKLPPAELGVHGGDNGFHQIYFICDDADAFVARMSEKGVETMSVKEESWGRSTGVKLPGGGTLGIYEARHQRP